ncbi:hypothetical protein [Yinghuangia seranimata]|uniref:hypothetical protein n=1 Tax=Yinghuangia seranimata TaxID=408067 RepID=UPI00248C2D6C|nr:hypothetical protein [Yinghuangia seranimata]MDI2125539.1 hypothetical protein [Yinghuangia seranimata]
MTLARKSTRRIVVDGTAYRWMLRGRPTYVRGMAWRPCAYVVERAEDPGRVLVVTTAHAHAGNFVGRPAHAVTPADVARAVRLALGRGWDPAVPGGPFELDLADGFVPF